MSEVWETYYTMSEKEKPKGLEELLEVIAGNVSKNSFKYSIFYNDVVADLTNCAINRAINGKNKSFLKICLRYINLVPFLAVGMVLIQKEKLLLINWIKNKK